MANNFSDVPIRSVAPVDVSWWNALRTAGIILQNLIGASTGAIADTAFTFVNNVGATNVTGLLFSSASGKSAYVMVSFKRRTDSSTRYGWTELWLRYNEDTAAWVLVDQTDHGDDPGLTFSVTAGGQVQYVSDNQAGANYNGASRFSAYTLGT